jgi:hypothetical protein
MKRRNIWVRRIAIVGGAVLVVGCVAAAGFLLVRSQTTPSLNQASFAAVSVPQDGSLVALHNQYNVVAEGFAGAGVRELQLWVNNQQWGTVALDFPRDRLTQTWAWVPSSEGEHHLVARLVAADGSVTESPLVRVYASAALDVRFPVYYETQRGDTADGIAAQFGTDVQTLLETNGQLDPSGSLPGGMDLTIPVPFTDSPPSQTDYGEPAAPPAGGLIVPEGSPVIDVVDGVHLAQAGGGVPLWKAFNLNDGILKPHEAVSLLYLYLSVNGKDWGRYPEDPNDYLQPQAGAFDLTGILKKVAAQAGGGPAQIHAEVWAWRQGELTYLGSYFGEVTTDGGGLQTTATGATQVRMIDYVYQGKEHYKQFAAISSDAPDLDEAFRWTTTLPGVTYALWQVSATGFPAGSTINPPGLVHQGMSPGSGGTFDLDFSDYFLGAGGGGSGGGFGGFGGFDFPNSLDDLLGGNDPSQQFIPWLPKAFFVRVIPMKGQYFPGVPGAVAGPPSVPVLVIYNPKGGYSPKVPPSGPAYEASVVGFQSYRPADPDYGACMVTNYELRDCRNVFGYGGGMESSQWSSVGLEDVENGKLTLAQYQQCGITVPYGTQSCGCPGVSCEGSSSGCSLSPTDWGDCVQEGFEAAGGALGSLVSVATGIYNGAVDFVTDALSSVACGALSGDDKKACEAGVGIAVNVGLASLGLPPEIPDFEKLMNEGLDYALAVAAEQISAQLGFECDKFCQDLIKAGIEGVSDPEKLMDDGLSFAASHAADELKDLGLDCDAKCQGLIQQAAEGDLQVSVAFGVALDKAAADAAAQLTANGYPCDAACQEKIRLSMEEARDLIVSSSNAAAAKPPAPLLLPHPLAVPQPAVVTVEIFRRYESGNVPQEDLDQCGLTIFTDTTTHVGSSEFSFSPFLGQGIELPAMAPGETIQVPIALERKFTEITPAMRDAVLAALQASGTPGGVIGSMISGAASYSTGSGVVSGTDLITWLAMYNGGSLEVKLSGSPFLTVVDGVGMNLPCVAEETWSTAIPKP